MTVRTHLGSRRARAFAGAIVAIPIVCYGCGAHPERVNTTQPLDATADAAPMAADPANDYLETSAIFTPEALGEIGIAGHEEDITDLNPNLYVRRDRALHEVLTRTDDALARETNPATRDDIAIVKRAVELEIAEHTLNRDRFIPHRDLGSLVFTGLKSQLKNPGKEINALRRVEKYAGLVPGFAPITKLERVLTESNILNSTLLFPSKMELEDELTKLPIYIAEIEKLLAEHPVAGIETPWATLRAQLQEHGAYVKETLLPRARTDFKLPPDVYDFTLRKMGVDLPRAKVMMRARGGYASTLEKMRVLAKQIGKKNKWPTRMLDVIERMKRDQYAGDGLKALYRDRLTEIEAIIKREKLLTLPERPVSFRYATAAETAQNPSPTIDIQALFKPGASIDFVFPVAITPKPGESPADLAYTDFTFAAMSWTVCAHEARPGHELQFSIMKERGLPLARTLFAFNSVNVEGWGLYSEQLIFPFMPPEGQLASLRALALRQARAFLDPGLHEGSISLAEAKRVLKEELGFSEGVIRQEIDRYTFHNPGQAASYYYGLERLLALRQRTEQAMGARFQQAAFHAFILGAGLLPPDLLEKAVSERFMRAQAH